MSAKETTAVEIRGVPTVHLRQCGFMNAGRQVACGVELRDHHTTISLGRIAVKVTQTGQEHRQAVRPIPHAARILWYNRGVRLLFSPAQE